MDFGEHLGKIGAWWDETTKPIGDGLQQIGDQTKQLGDTVGSGINEATRAVTGGSLLDPVRDSYDLGFITIKAGSKGKREPGGYHFATSAAQQNIEFEDDEEEQDAEAAIENQHKVENRAAQLGFIKLVPKKETGAKRVVKSHFSDGRSHDHKTGPALRHLHTHEVVRH